MKPFMSYQGGKRKLLPYLRPNLPDSYRDYYEPFLGGGALALEVVEQAYLAGDRGHTFYLSDYSQDVVDAWTAVKESPEALEAELRLLFEHHNSEQFMMVRNWDRQGVVEAASTVQRAARFIYLASTSFGGAVTQTRQGIFAMAPNKQPRSFTFDFNNLRAVSHLLNELDTRIFHASYEEAIASARFGDFVFLDPPYATDGDGGKALSSNYLTGGFDQRGVLDAMLTATARGAYVLMTNSDTATTRELWEGWAAIRPTFYWCCGGTGKQAAELMVANWRLAEHLAERQPVTA